MLAYSAISHMGFMLLALPTAWSAATDPFNAADAYSAAMYYVVAYVLTSSWRCSA
jgi:NADH-quinone oxidoreductase subunit N